MTNKKDKSLTCVWRLDNLCEGEVKNKMIFNPPIEVTTCLKHYTNHIEIMTLYANGWDVEEAIDMDNEKQTELANKYSDIDIVF